MGALLDASSLGVEDVSTAMEVLNVCVAGDASVAPGLAKLARASSERRAHDGASRSLLSELREIRVANGGRCAESAQGGRPLSS